MTSDPTAEARAGIAVYHDDDGTPYCIGCDAEMIPGSEEPHGKDCVVVAAIKEGVEQAEKEAHDGGNECAAALADVHDGWAADIKEFNARIASLEAELARVSETMIECHNDAFNNRQELDRLKDPEHLSALADAIADAIIAFDEKANHSSHVILGVLQQELRKC